MDSSREILRECSIRGLSVRANALRKIQDVTSMPYKCSLHTLIDVIATRLDHSTVRVVDMAIVCRLHRPSPTTCFGTCAA